MLILMLRHQLRHREQRGQTLLIFALAFIVLVGIVGLATDSAFGYYESVQIERAAAAAALAGVPYMPGSFTTPVAGPNATTRAVAEATGNGFTNGGNVSVVVTRTGSPQELQVQITQQIPTFFLRGLGIQSYTVARTAVARYRQPIALGQPGNTLGATVSQLASGGNFYFLREKGWNTQRAEGDAFTPHPTDGDCTYNYSGPLPGSGACGVTPQAVSDVHRISSQVGTESNDPLTGGAQPLPSRGGYNYLITIPTGETGSAQVYNAVYGPDFAGTHNNCENVLVHSGANCSATGAYYHEDDVGGNAKCAAPPVCTPLNQHLYNASEFTLFRVKDIFLRRTDKVLTRTTVYPIDATNWNATPPTYTDVKNQATITQTFDVLGNPTNMNVYHSWSDIANLQNPKYAPASLINRQTGGGYVDDSLLGPGTYRLRVDSVNFDGVTPTVGTCPVTPNLVATVVCGASSKGYGVRVNGCATCTISALEDMCVDVPVTGGGGSIPIFNLSSDYAGATVNADFYDVGDTSDTNELSVLDPLTGATIDTGGPTLNLIVDGVNQPPAPQIRHFKPQPPDGPAVGPIFPHTGGFMNSQAGFEADTSGTSNSNGTWVEFQIPVPSAYAGSANYYKLNYDIKNNGTANDTFTLAVNATGGPIRLFRS